MSSMKEIFSRLTTPDGWQEKLYNRIDMGTAPKRRTPKKIAAVTAIAAALVCGITVSAVEYYSWRQTLKTDFGDEISAAKLDSGAYQPLDISDGDGLLSVQAVAFVGDTADSYVIAEARLGENAPAGFDRFGLEVKMYGENTEQQDQAANRYYGIPQTDGNGGTVYVFRIRTVTLYVGDAAENGSPMTVHFTKAAFEKTDSGKTVWHTVRDTDLRLSFTPDKAVLKDAVSADIGKELSLNGYTINADKFISSEYCARAVFNFSVTGEENWQAGDDRCRELLNIGENPGGAGAGFDPESCPIRLVVDGGYVPFVRRYTNEYGADLIEPLLLLSYAEQPEKFCFVLSFEPFDYEAAESVALEFRGADGSTETVTIK